MRVKILFVCHGNICRSPMAAMVFRYLAQQRHVSGEFEVDSAALSSEEIGNGIYPPARRILVKHGVPCTEHRARQITPEDFETADLIIGMEWGALEEVACSVSEGAAGEAASAAGLCRAAGRH